MIIVMSATKNWYHYLMVALYSLLESTKNIRKIYLLVETNKIEDIKNLNKIIDKYEANIKLINFNIEFEKLVEEDNINRNTVYSNFCFARLALPNLINEDKVLYIDTDVIIKKDISKIWRLNIDEYYVAGVRDLGVLTDKTYERMNITGKYINSGFVIFNLKKIRKDNIQQKWFEIINSRELKYPDQDALNYICQHSELYIPSMYNFSHGVTREVVNKDLIKVYHYAGKKTQWIVDKFYCEEWYDIEEKYYDEFGD